MNDDPDVYNAEKIVAVKRFQGVTKYLIKWAGFPDSQATWEPEEHIIDQTLLTAYNEEQEQKKLKKQGRQRGSTKKRKPTTSASTSSEPPAKKSKSPDSTSTPCNGDEVESELLESTIASASSDTREVQTQVEDTNNPIAEPELPHHSNSTSVQTSTPVKNEKTTSPNASATPTKLNSPQRSSTPLQAKFSPSELQIATPIAPRLNSSDCSTMPVPLRGGPVRNKRSVIMNTFITDVTARGQTITISESKTNQGFFSEVSRHNVAVDAPRIGEINSGIHDHLC